MNLEHGSNRGRRTKYPFFWCFVVLRAGPHHGGGVSKLQSGPTTAAAAAAFVVVAAVAAATAAATGGGRGGGCGGDGGGSVGVGVGRRRASLGGLAGKAVFQPLRRRLPPPLAGGGAPPSPAAVVALQLMVFRHPSHLPFPRLSVCGGGAVGGDAADGDGTVGGGGPNTKKSLSKLAVGGGGAGRLVGARPPQGPVGYLFDCHGRLIGGGFVRPAALYGHLAHIGDGWACSTVRLTGR